MIDERARDEAHRRRIIESLEASRDIDVIDVHVAVADGVITLTGEVGSVAEHHAVRSLTVADRATIEVVDRLWSTPLPGAWGLDDAEIAALVDARLKSHPEFARVIPTCDFHTVYLDGVVSGGEHRRLAHHLARTTPGVHFVVDRIETVTPARRGAARVAR
jgi:osmotically-inducible protein OsmY